MPTYGLHAASPHPERSFRARQMVTFFLDPSFRAREMLTYGLYAASPLLNGRFVHAKWFLLDPSFRAREMLICESMLPVVS